MILVQPSLSGAEGVDAGMSPICIRTATECLLHFLCRIKPVFLNGSRTNSHSNATAPKVYHLLETSASCGVLPRKPQGNHKVDAAQLCYNTG